jgi:hypothetical protein
MLHDNVRNIIDVDGIGLLCELCDVRDWPPHYEYLHKLLRAKLADKSQVYAIANFAYPICAEVEEDKQHKIWRL